MDKDGKSRPKTGVLDGLTSQLAMLLWKSSMKIKTLHEVVAEESKLLGADTLSSVEDVIKKQGKLQAAADKCLQLIDSQGSSVTPDKPRSLTVSIRNADLRRLAEKSASPSLREKHLTPLMGIDPIPTCLQTEEKERCASLDRKEYRTKSRSTPSLHSVRATSTKSIMDAICSFIPTPTSSRSRTMGQSQQIDGGSTTSPLSPWATPFSPPQHSSTPSTTQNLCDESLRSHAAELRLDRIMADHSPISSLPGASVPQHSLNFPEYRHPPPPPPVEECRQAIKTLPQPLPSQFPMNESDAEGRTSPVASIPRMPSLYSDKFFQFFSRNPPGLPPCLNEVTKSFDTEDVLKYTQKRPRNGVIPMGTIPLPPQEVGQGEITSFHLSSGLHTIMSNYSDDGEEDEDYFNLRQSPSSSFQRVGPLRELRSNNSREREIGSYRSIPSHSPNGWEPSPSSSSHDLQPSPNLSFRHQAPSAEVVDPKGQDIQRRLNTFRLRIGLEDETGEQWENLARTLGNADLDLLLEVLEWDPQLLRKEERKCVVYSKFLRRKPEEQPPKLPPKQTPGSGGRGGGYLAEEETEWEGIKPTIV